MSTASLKEGGAYPFRQDNITLARPKLQAIIVNSLFVRSLAIKNFTKSTF